MIDKFLKDFLKYSPSIIIPGIIGFISIPVLTHFFNPLEYGNYVLVQAIIGVVTIFAGWIHFSIVRFNAIYEKEGNSGFFYAVILKLTFLSAIFITAIYLLLIYFLKDDFSVDFKYLLFAASAVLFFSILFESFKQFLRAQNKPGIYSFLESISKVTAFLIGILLIYFLKTGIIGMLYGVTAAYILIFPAIFLFSRYRNTTYDFKNSRITKKFLVETSKYGLPLMFSYFLTWVLSLSDRFIIEHYYTAKEVGIYSASYKIAEYSVSVIIMLIVFSGTPLLINTWEREGHEKSRDLNIKITRFFLLATIPLSVFISIYSKNIVSILTAKDYTEGYRIIPVIIAGVFLLGLQERFYPAFYFFKKTNFIIYSLILAAFINILLNFIFVPRFGYLAAAMNTLFAYVISMIMIVILSLKLFKWKFPFKTLLKTVISSVVMGFAAYFCNKYIPISPVLSVILGILLSILIYTGVLFLTKELKKSNFHFISGLKNLKKK
jgi:O-antigen/teichoic acid export membrane protein